MKLGLGAWFKSRHAGVSFGFEPTAGKKDGKERTGSVQRVRLDFNVEPAYESEWGEGKLSLQRAAK